MTNGVAIGDSAGCCGWRGGSARRATRQPTSPTGHCAVPRWPSSPGCRNGSGLPTAGRLLYTETRQPARTGHEIDRLLGLAGAPPGAHPPALFPSAEDQRVVNQVLTDAGIAGDFVALAPGSIWGTKRWPYFEALAAGLAPRFAVAVVGGPDDAALGRRVADGGAGGRRPGGRYVRASYALAVHRVDWSGAAACDQRQRAAALRVRLRDTRGGAVRANGPGVRIRTRRRRRPGSGSDGTRVPSMLGPRSPRVPARPPSVHAGSAGGNSRDRPGGVRCATSSGLISAGPTSSSARSPRTVRS